MQHNYTYNLPRKTFNLLEETLGSKEKAETFAGTMEEFLHQIDDKAVFMITDKLENIRFQIKNDLTTTMVNREIFEERIKSIEDLTKTLVTKEMFEERFKVLDERFNTFDERFQSINDKFDEKFKNLSFRFTILIALVIAALTFANPAFVKFLERLIF